MRNVLQAFDDLLRSDKTVEEILCNYMPQLPMAFSGNVGILNEVITEQISGIGITLTIQDNVFDHSGHRLCVLTSKDYTISLVIQTNEAGQDYVDFTHYYIWRSTELDALTVIPYVREELSEILCSYSLHLQENKNCEADTAYILLDTHRNRIGYTEATKDSAYAFIPDFCLDMLSQEIADATPDEKNELEDKYEALSAYRTKDRHGNSPPKN